MRYLDRSAVPAPTCLSRFDPRKHAWDELERADKEEIRHQLGVLRHDHCAYCECDVQQESRDPHIEHFEQRSRARNKTFDWNNLFWSCSRPERCGKHQDSAAGRYEPSDLLKPDIDDPRRYLFFASDGAVVPRSGLDVTSRRRAEETIRVFALDDGGLQGMRKAYLAGPLGSLLEIQEAGFAPAEAEVFIQDLADIYADKQFSSAVLDVLGIAP